MYGFTPIQTRSFNNWQKYSVDDMDEIAKHDMQDKEFWCERMQRSKKFYFSMDKIYPLAFYQLQFFWVQHLPNSRHYLPWKKLYMNNWQIKSMEDGFDSNYHKCRIIPFPLLLQCVSYPHKDADKTVALFRKTNVFFLSEKNVSKLEQLQHQYEEIKRAAWNDALWVAALKSTKDHQFIIDNVEYCLGGNLDNQNLWKLYIEYLKSSGDVETLLQTYSKYCRFFEDHAEVFEEYKFLAELNPPVAVPWVTQFMFEDHDPGFLEKMKKKFNIKRNVEASVGSFHVRINSKTAMVQQFALPLDQMQFIRDNASPQLLFKLYQSCKWFPLRRPLTLCYQINVNNDLYDVNDIRFLGNSLRLHEKDLKQLSYNKIFVSDAIIFCKTSSRSLSNFLPKLFKCFAKVVALHQQEVYKEDISNLIKYGSVQHLTMELPNLPFLADFFLEDIMPSLPNLETLILLRVQCGSQSFKLINQCNFEKKIKVLNLRHLNNKNLDAKDFAQFIINRCTPDVKIFLSFCLNDGEPYVNRVREFVNDAISSWKSSGSEFQISLYPALKSFDTVV